MNNEIFFSIIIINYNTCELTTKCIESIYQHLKNKVGYEIICFDNNSSDNSVEAIESRYPKVALIKNKENIGFGRANNYCFKLAKGKNILLLNTDSYLIDDSIIRMMEFLRSRRDIAVVGGALIYPEGGMQINFGKFPTFIFNNYYSRFIHKIAFKLWSLKNPLEVDYISGAYFLIKKEILDEVGYFDERFWMYYEEIDLCRRIKKRGYKVYYYPESTIVHLENRAFSDHQKNLKRKYRKIFYEVHYGKLMAKFISMFDIK